MRARGCLEHSKKTPCVAEPLEARIQFASGPAALVADLNPGPDSSVPANFITVGQMSFFAAVIDASHNALVATDGTPGGTTVLHTFAPAFNLAIRGATGGELYFSGGDTRLWKSDGTPVGTALVSPIFPVSFASFAGHQFVGASSGLWVTDGTATGTVMIKSDVVPSNMVVVGSRLFFFDSYEDTTLWESDGTSAGTTPVFTVPQGQRLMEAAPLGNNLLFSTEQVGSTTVDEELWRTDGTAVGTTPLHTWHQPDVVQQRGPDNLVAFDGDVYFRVADGTDSTDGLWKTDGTTEGTAPVFTMPVDFHPFLSNLTAAGNALYFIGISTRGYPYTTLYKSDGSTAGTAPVAPDLAIAPVSNFIAAYGSVFFLGAQAASNTLWQTDGTAEGTLPIADVGNSGSGDLGAVNGFVLFDKRDADHGLELWDVQVASSTVTGSVFVDTNHNGVRDPGESGMAGVAVYLDLSHDGEQDPGDPVSVSGTDGTYRFGGLAADSYTVGAIAPSGYAVTAPVGYSATVSVAANEDGTGPTFGLVALGAVPLDFSYLLVLVQHYNAAGTFAAGDLNGDGRIDFADLLLLAQHYNRTLTAVR